MLTEPLTAPTARWPRLAFAAIVGFLFAPNIHIGSFYFTPELALLAGNLFAYAVSPKGRFVLTLERIEQSAIDSYDFVFRSPGKLAFRAGQYLEWTLGLDRSDNRGNRRYFTVASAPTEQIGPTGRQVLSDLQRLQAGAGRDEAGQTRSMPPSWPATSPCRPTPKPSLPFWPEASASRRSASMLQYLLDREGGAADRRSLWNREPAGYRLPRRARRCRDANSASGRSMPLRAAPSVASIPATLTIVWCARRSPTTSSGPSTSPGPRPWSRRCAPELRAMGVRRSKIKVDYFPGFA